MTETALRTHDNHHGWMAFQKLEDDAYTTPSHDKRSNYGWNVISARGPHLRLVKPAATARAVKPLQMDARLELRRLADEWKTDMLFVSSIQEQILHPSYQKIIGFGEKALPFLIDELRASDANWFWALSMITRADPVAAEDQGNYPAMKEAWLNWATANGL